MKKNRPGYLFISLLLLALTFSGCSLGNRQQAATPTAGTEIYLPVVPSGENLEDLPGEAEALSTATLESSPITAQETETPEAILEEVPEADSLKGLSFNQFLEDSFKLILLRDPEWVTVEGLSREIGTDDSQLTDISIEYQQATQALLADILQILKSYDRATLPPGEQLSYDTYAWYLDDQIRQIDFIDFEYLINHMTILGMQYQLEQLMTEVHRVTDETSARAYLSRLSQVGKKIDQITERLQRSADKKIIPPRFVIDWSFGDIRSMGTQYPRATSYYTSFEQRLHVLSSIPPETQQEMLDQAASEIESSVQPAYMRLGDKLQELRMDAPEAIGVGQYPGGSAYYQQVLRHHTTTELTPDEIHQLGLEELEKIQAQMRVLFADLGYPAELSLVEAYERVVQDSGTVSGEAVMDEYRQLIADAESRLDQAFTTIPDAELVIQDYPGGSAYYVSPALDGSRPGMFFVGVQGDEPRYNMPTLVYHEAVPGHHLQISLTQELDLPLFQRIIGFTAYVEGWALYAEQLASELGWYDDDPYGNLGRLQMAAYRAARLVVDTGIHAKGWSFDEAQSFMEENIGLPPGSLQYEIARYAVYPGQATSYYIGFLKILELRQRVEEALGEDYDLKAFHSLILDNGSLPLDLLEKTVLDQLVLASSHQNNDHLFYSLSFTENLVSPGVYDSRQYPLY